MSLCVKFEPPKLVPPPDGLSVSFVTGDCSEQELVLVAIEAKRDNRWICGLEFDPRESVDVQPLHVEELAEPDADLTRRRYRFPLVNRSLPAGQHMVTATIRTREGSRPAGDPLAVWVNVVDSVAIVPNPLVIRYAQGSPPPSRRVRVICRSGNQAIAAPAEYNHDLLHVEVGQQVGSTAAFEIVPLDAPESAVETQVAFDIVDHESRVLVVRFEPSEPH